MKKVALFIKQLDTIGGTQRVTVGLASCLSQYFDVTVIRMYGGVHKDLDFPEQLKTLALFDRPIKLRNRMLSYCARLSKIFKEERFDCILFIGRNNSFLALPLAKLYGIVTIFCEHFTLFPYGRSFNFKEKLVRSIFNFFVFKFSRKIVVLTNKERELIVKSKHKLNSKIVVIPNYVDSSLAPVLFDCKSRNLLTIANNFPYKGFDLLISIARKLKNKYPNYQWDIYGAGYGEIELNKIYQSGLENNVYLRGPISNFVHISKNYLAYCCTSRSEGFPLVLLEAKKVGLPVVSFDINSGPSELVSHNVNGYLVEPFDVISYANRLNDLLCNQGLPLIFSKNSKLGLERINKENILSKWVKLIEHINL